MYLYILCVITGGCGLRIGEALALTDSDVDLNRNIIKINKQQNPLKGKCYIIVNKTKTESGTRIVVIPKFVRNSIIEYRIIINKIISKSNLIHNSKSKYILFQKGNNSFENIKSTDLFIITNACKMVRKNTAQRNWKNFRENLGYTDKIRIHDFRRFGATLLMKNNVPDKFSASQLGHANTTMTQYYQNIDEETLTHFIQSIDI